MNRTSLLFLAATLTVNQMAIAQSDNSSHMDPPAKDTSMSLKAMKAMPAPTTKDDTSITLGGSAKPKTMIQYLLMLPCQGWNTTAITLSGFPPRLTTPITEQSNSFIDPDLLKEYSCQQLAKRVLRRGQRKIIIDAYQFATKDGAYATYCAAHKGSSSYAPQGDASSEDQESISFCQDRYFVYLYSTTPDDEEAKATINTIVKQLTDYSKPTKDNQTIVPNKAQPEIFTYMPNLERLSGSERMAMGAISLKKFFPAPYSSDLAPLTTGAIADYKLAEPERDRLKLLIANYPSTLEAVKIFDNYVGTLRKMHKEKTIEGYSSPAVLFKLADCFLFCQLRKNIIIVINGARHKDSLADLAHRIYF